MTLTKYVGGNTAKDLLKYEVYEGTTLVQTIWFNTSGRITKAVDAQGRMVIYEYDAFGRVTKITDENGSFSTMEYDRDGNLVYSRNTNGEELRYTYSADGKLETLQDSKGNVTTFHYDAKGNLTGIERADGTSSGLTYNSNGTVATTMNRRGDTYEYTYNEKGQLVENKPSTADNPICYEYDARGNTTKITDGDKVTTMTYNDKDLLTRIDYPGGRWIEYTYDDFGRQTSIKFDDDYHVQYTYNSFCLLESIIDVLQGNKVVTHYEYDAQGRPIKETQGNGTYTEYHYDSLGFLLTKTDYDKNDAVLSQFQYVYNDKGLVGEMTTHDGTWTYDYDSIGQLTSAIFVSANAEIENREYKYIYDAAGNRIETITNGTSVEYVVNSMNQYTKIGNYEYKYDADGNMVEKYDTDTGEMWTFEWCQGNWLRSSTMFDADGNEVEKFEYEYDAFGNRIAVIHNGERTEYLVDLSGYGNVIAEYDEDYEQYMKKVRRYL
jgi:YD repeat-containing protein